MNLKKILSAIGLLTVAVPSSLIVSACGNQQGSKYTNWAKWGLEAYTKENKVNQIWITKEDSSKIKDEKLDLTWYLWAGIFDADDKDKNHDRQLERYNRQEINKYLIITNLTAVKEDLFTQAVKAIKDKKDNFTISGVELNLTKDLESKTTDTESEVKDQVKDYLLQKSEAKINIKVNIH